MSQLVLFVYFFFFNDPAPTEIYPLSLHDALPILLLVERFPGPLRTVPPDPEGDRLLARLRGDRKSHTSELQSHLNLVCRLLLEKKIAGALRDAAKEVINTGHRQTAVQLG